jgi:hypothetical protein
MVRGRTAAQLVALYIGLWWTSNGILTFATGDTNFAVGNVHGSADLLGMNIAVNGWHGMFHLLTGLTGIAVFARPEAARTYLLAVAGLYLVAAGWGLIVGQAALGVMSVDVFGSLVHGGEGLIALTAALLSPRTASPARPGGAPARA